MIDFSHLNPQQKRAVETTEGPLLVLAGAGSGKTRVITNRISYLVNVKKVPPSQILAITFTNKAAKEMSERVDSMLKRKHNVFISTFHSFGLRLLKTHIEKVGYKKNFSIIEESDRISIVKTGLRKITQSFSDYDPAIILNKISLGKNRGWTKGHWDNVSDPYDLVMNEIYEFYNERLVLNNLVDFDDLLLLPVKILQNNEDILFTVSRHFRYVMVDEYQDTNGIQEELLKLIASYYRNICVVGDDDQSIYGWRGADSNYILNFSKNWPGCQEIILEQNYRSTNTILTAANQVIKNNLFRNEKNLWSQIGTGEKLKFYLAESDRDEAEFIARQIHHLKKNSVLTFDDFCVLYRRNTQSRVIEELFRINAIPYQLVGSYTFYDRKEIKDIISYLKFILNPNDELALERIINIPNRGLGKASLDKILAFAHYKKLSLYDALKMSFTIEGLTNQKQTQAYDFTELIQNYIEKFKTNSIGDTVRALLNEIDYKSYLKVFSKTDEELALKMDIVKEFINSMYDYEKRFKDPTLEKFIERILLFSQDDEKEALPSVKIMSIHASKGLEFNTVFLIGLEEGIFPSSRTIQETNDVSEERRLAYVGITRAQRYLFLSSVKERKKYNETIYPDISRFLKEIPGDLFEIPPHKLGDEKTILTKAKEAATDFFNQIRSIGS